jgi:hypothetical protein
MDQRLRLGANDGLSEGSAAKRGAVSRATFQQTSLGRSIVADSADTHDGFSLPLGGVELRLFASRLMGQDPDIRLAARSGRKLSVSFRARDGGQRTLMSRVPARALCSRAGTAVASRLRYRR